LREANISQKPLLLQVFFDLLPAKEKRIEVLNLIIQSSIFSRKKCQHPSKSV